MLLVGTNRHHGTGLQPVNQGVESISKGEATLPIKRKNCAANDPVSPQVLTYLDFSHMQILSESKCRLKWHVNL